MPRAHTQAMDEMQGKLQAAVKDTAEQIFKMAKPLRSHSRRRSRRACPLLRIHAPPRRRCGRDKGLRNGGVLTAALSQLPSAHATAALPTRRKTALTGARCGEGARVPPICLSISRSEGRVFATGHRLRLLPPPRPYRPYRCTRFALMSSHTLPSSGPHAPCLHVGRRAHTRCGAACATHLCTLVLRAPYACSRGRMHTYVHV